VTVHARDPRAVAQRAEEYLKSSGIADVCYFGPEAEFFIFTSARWGEGMNKSFYEVDRMKAPGTPVAMEPRIWRIVRVPKKAISPPLPSINCKTCVPKWSLR